MRARALADAENPRGHGRPDRVAALARQPADRVRDRQEKTWGSKQGGWRGLREIERVKVPVDSIPKAHPALRDQIARWSRSAGERKIAVANKPGCKLLWFGMPKWKP